MILVVGPGAVGTVLAAHLIAAGRDEVMLGVRDRHLAALGAVPSLRVEFPTRRPALVVPRPEVTAAPTLDGVDHLVLCVKFPDLEPLLNALPPVPADCTVVSTLNGVAPLRLLRDRLPQARVVPVSVMFNGQLVAPLHAKITTKPQILVGSADPRLVEAFAGSGMDVRRVAGDSAVWGKLLINLANAICGLTRSTFRDLLTDRDLRAAYVAVLDEAVSVLGAAHIDYELPVPLPYPAYRRFLLHGGPLPWWVSKVKNGLRDGAYPSMVADLEQGRPTEVDQLNGEIARLAERHGAAAPANARLVEMIKVRPAGQPLSARALRERLGV